MEENKIAENETTEKEVSFDDLLKNPNYQREFDKKLEGARQKWEAKWQEKANAEKSEAERLAKLSETERFEEQIKKLQSEKDELLAKQNATALKEEAIKIATKNGVDVRFLDLFDFSKETAETIKEKITILKDNFEAQLKTKLNEKLVQDTPKEVKESTKTSTFSRASY